MGFLKTSIKIEWVDNTLTWAYFREYINNYNMNILDKANEAHSETLDFAIYLI